MQTRIVQRTLCSCCRFPIPFSRAMIFPFVFVGVCILSKLLHFTAHILHIAITITTYLYCTLRHKKVVGYQEYALTKANLFVTSSFKNVGGTALDLTQIKVVGYTGASSDKASVQFIDGAGNVAKDSNGKSMVYYWRDADGSNGKWVKKDGRNIIDVTVGEATLGAGEALWWQKNTDGLSLQFSGEAIQDKTEVALPLANQAVGNMMAVPVDLIAINVVGYTGSTSDKVSVQIIDGSGNVAKDANGKSMVYYWRDASGTSGKWIKKDGRNIIDVVADEVVLNPGDGIWVQNNDLTTSYKLEFLAPTL